MNKLSQKQCRHYQNNLYKMSDKELIKAVKDFLNSENVFYLNTDESIAKYHAKLPLKTFGLSEYITDDYFVLKSKTFSKLHTLKVINYSDIDYLILTCEKPEKLQITIGAKYGKYFNFSWVWAHKHAHYDSDYLYDNFVTTTFRNKKLDRILNQ